MKRKILLLLVMSALITGVSAQKAQKKVTGYAITADQKGRTGWKEVRLVDINSGEELQTIYKANQETEILNARTGKPIQKKDLTTTNPESKTYTISYSGNGDNEKMKEELKKQLLIAKENMKDVDVNVVTSTKTTTVTTDKKDKPVYSIDANGDLRQKIECRVVIMKTMGTPGAIQSDKPFATNSAAMAYDREHERLYYTPMNINQLRYIDLKTKKIYYFEDEPFGKVSGYGDVGNQITRMVFASDKNGYALTNNANHLIRFTTGKKPEITDLGALADDPANGNNSIHSSRGYGGDIIADASKNLYLITANRNVYKISIETKVATFVGTITGLPKGFSTNGAMVEAGSKVIVASSEQTVGYYRFDLDKITEAAEKVSTSGDVYNASDLANGNLAYEKKKKDKKEPKEEEQQPIVEEKKPVTQETAARPTPPELLENKGIAVFPNPVTSGYVKMSFADQPAGRYQVQLLDVSGKLVNSTEVNINSKSQVEEFRMPELKVSGTYFLRIASETNKVSSVTKLIVQ